jgi:hypothetical protein
MSTVTRANAIQPPADRRTQSAGQYTLGIVLGLLTALIAAAQIQPVASQFMQAMHGSMETHGSSDGNCADERECRS